MVTINPDQYTDVYDAAKSDPNTALARGCAASAKVAQAYLCVNQERNGFMQALMGIIGIYGFIKQADLLERQTDLQEEVVEQGREYLELAQRTFEEVTLDAYRCQKGLFERFKNLFQKCESEFLDESKRLVEYEPKYKVQEGRAVSSVQAAMDRARKRRSRQRGKYATGQCCHEDIWFAMETARLEVDAVNHAYRYEDDKKIRLDDWYWSRQTTGAQMVENMRAQVINAVNGGVSNVSGGLSSIGSALGELRLGTNGLSGALRDQASFFGTLSNGAFRAAGFTGGQQAGQQVGPSSTWFGSGAGNSGPAGLFGGFAQPGSSIGGGGATSGSISGFLNPEFGDGFAGGLPGVPTAPVQT